MEWRKGEGAVRNKKNCYSPLSYIVICLVNNNNCSLSVVVVLDAFNPPFCRSKRNVTRITTL